MAVFQRMPLRTPRARWPRWSLWSKGLKAKRADRATTQAFLRVLVLPWAVFITVFIAVNFAEQHGGYDLKPTFWVAVWFGIGMLNNLILFTSAQRSLLGKLRLLASEQFSLGSAAGGERPFWFAKPPTENADLPAPKNVSPLE